MSGGLFNPVGGSGLYGLLQTKRRIFVSYHHGGDRAYYDAFSRTFCDQYDVIEDNSLDRAIDSADVDYVRRRLSENCITGSSCTIRPDVPRRRCAGSLRRARGGTCSD
jgi:hypothetical protein